ncbi:MAG: Transketolase 1 [Alphaproteobacteria bacterium ADurb.Bin438]|nr:MAG: Transketolase 1 [Alphaproteobacteria bacterium ADurb.Bin438]
MVELRDLSNAVKFLAADAVGKANSGHPGMPLGTSDIATVLFHKFLKFDAKNPKWFDRDRFVLSAGHGSALLYSLLYLSGYDDATIDDLKNFRQLGSKMAGHPEYGHLSGVENTSGPLGQGVAMATGMALSEAMLNARFGSDLVNHYTYVICGDGCLMEGISEEAISVAGHLKLNKLILMWDNNQITIDGKTSITTTTDQIARFKANNWNTIEVDDGHDFDKIEEAIEKARKSDKPTFIAFKTIIGHGAPNKQGSHKTHGSPLGDEEILAMRKALNWNCGEFVIPDDILKAWRDNGVKSSSVREAYEAKANENKEFLDVVNNKFLKAGWNNKLNEAKAKWLSEKPKVATRKASQMVLEQIVPEIPSLIGGSADLTASNLTKVCDMKDVNTSDYIGRYINYGIREHSMTAIMNGIILHGGFIPYAGGFFVFSDYMRPAIRLAALMQIRSIYVLTHDSIGVGEDGPTHQPIEHLASFRAMPNVLVFRPCDLIETAECWELAVVNEKRPSILALSRQNLPTLRTSVDKNMAALGGYVISPEKDKRKATIIATGSEVEIAIQAQKHLAEKGIDVAVVSMPCCELFDSQTRKYQEEVLGNAPRIGVEAAIKYGWEKYIGNGEFVGMNSFGASGPAEKLYQHFNITALAVVDAVLKSI